MSGDGACTWSQPGTGTWRPTGADWWKFKTCISTVQRLSENKLWRSSDSHLCVCANTTWYTSNTQIQILKNPSCSALITFLCSTCYSAAAAFRCSLVSVTLLEVECTEKENMTFQRIWWQLGLYYFWGLKPFKTENSSWSDFEHTVQSW